MWEQGDHPTLVSLNVPVGEGREELLNMLPAPSDAEESLLADALRRLPARDCLVLRLRYYHGLSQSAIGQIIGRTQMQVSRIERDALAKLRDFASDAFHEGAVKADAGASARETGPAGASSPSGAVTRPAGFEPATSRSGGERSIP